MTDLVIVWTFVLMFCAVVAVGTFWIIRAKNKGSEATIARGVGRGYPPMPHPFPPPPRPPPMPRGLVSDDQGSPDLLHALKALVLANEQWNADVEAIIGRRPTWTDGYLDAARTAIAKAE